MSRIRSLWRRLAGYRDAERALDEEVRGAFESLVERHRESGLDPIAARRAAALEFGHVEAVKQEVRDVRTGAWLEGLVQDVRYAARGIRRAPWFALAAAGSIGIGIAGNAIIFSLADAWLLRQRPGLVDSVR